jgi:hypothetical protein
MARTPQPLTIRIEPGERVLWQQQPGTTAPTPSESSAAQRWGIGLGVLAAVLTRLADVSWFGATIVFLIAAIATATFLKRSARLSAGRCYAITDRRLLIVDGDETRAFAPTDVTWLDVRKHTDGTADLVWGEEKPSLGSTTNPDQHGWKASARFTFPYRRLSIGFLGLPASEPAESLIRTWLDRHHGRAAAGIPAGADPASDRSDAATVAISEDWQRITQPDFGFEMAIPSTWRWQTAHVKLLRILGIPFLPGETKWSDTPQPGWNTLTTCSEDGKPALQVTLDPERMPANLDAVLNDRWAKIVNLGTLESDPDVRIGSLAGFSVVHKLEGAGPSVSLGPVKVGMGAIKDRLAQTQIWLRGSGHSVHVTYVTPIDAPALREAYGRIVATIGFRG